MTLALRTLALLAFALPSVPAFSAEGQAPSTLAQPSGKLSADSLEFAGVMSVGGKTMINLYDKQSKQSYWVETGATLGGITVVKYDGAKDEVTIRQDGAEKNIPLRTGAGVMNAPASSAPAAAAPTGAAATPTTSATPISQLSKARQEEEARMLVSDLLEIGMAQRKAYEDAQRRIQNGQPAQAPAAPDAASTQQPASQQAAVQQAPVQATPSQPEQSAQASANSQQPAQ